MKRKYEELVIKIDKLQEEISQNKQDKNLQIELEKMQTELKELISKIRQSNR
jgi:ribosomal protein S15P/S13E